MKTSIKALVQRSHLKECNIWQEMITNQERQVVGKRIVASMAMDNMAIEFSQCLEVYKGQVNQVWVGIGGSWQKDRLIWFICRRHREQVNKD